MKNNSAMFKITYGLFVLTAKNGSFCNMDVLLIRFSRLRFLRTEYLSLLIKVIIHII